MRKRGYSLLELIFAVSLLGIVTGVAILGWRKAANRAGSRALAEQVAEEVRACRSHATAKGFPMAISFPSDNGTHPFTRTLRQLGGSPLAALLQSHTLGADFQGFLYTGRWSGGVFDDLSPADTAGAVDSFDVNSWLGPSFDVDPAIVFLPSGKAKAHPLKVACVSGRYRIIVSQGGQVATAPQPTADSLSDPYTVSVSSLGEVTVEPGLPGGFDGPPKEPTVAWAPGPSSSNQPPVIHEVVVLPDANVSINGARQHTISETGMEIYPKESNNGQRNLATVTVSIRASDPDNDSLYFSWRAVPLAPAGVGAGAFSYPQSSRMRPAGSAYPTHSIGFCDWQPPAEVQLGSQWRFVGTVTDGRGGSADTDLNLAGGQHFIKVQEPGKVAFDKHEHSNAAGDTQDVIYVMNIDGTAVTRITNLPDVNENAPDLSPSGDSLVFASSRAGSDNQSDIYLASTDGTVRLNLTQTPLVGELWPKWSPSGNFIAYYTDIGASTQKYRILTKAPRRNDGIHILPYSDNADSTYPCSWSPNAKFICFVKMEPAGNSLYISKVEGTATENRRFVGASTHDIRQAAWSPRGDKIVFVSKSGGLYYISVNQNNPLSMPLPTVKTILDPSQKVQDFGWSPKGRHLAITYDADGNGIEQLGVMDVALNPPYFGSTIRRLTSGYNCFEPVFTTNGNHLVVRANQPNYDHNTVYRLYRVPVNVAVPLTTIKNLTDVSKDVASHSVSR